jgi:outer membrane receptor for Fe3+-dicitrate
MNIGMRYQKAYYDFNQKSPSIERLKKSPNELVSTTGVKYVYGQRSNIFFNFHETFRFLASDEWYDTWNGLNSDLKHQTGAQYEAGLKHDFSSSLSMSFTPYMIETKNEIF